MSGAKVLNRLKICKSFFCWFYNFQFYLVYSSNFILYRFLTTADTWSGKCKILKLPSHEVDLNFVLNYQENCAKLLASMRIWLGVGAELEFQYITFYEYLLSVTQPSKTHYPQHTNHHYWGKILLAVRDFAVFLSHRCCILLTGEGDGCPRCVLTARVCLTDWAIYSSWLFYQQPVKKAEQQNPSSCRYCIVPPPARQSACLLFLQGALQLCCKYLHEKPCKNWNLSLLHWD